MPLSHKWSPIADIPDAAALSDGELPALIEVWKDQGGALAAPGAVSKFSEQLNREWAIETGIIERAYTLDRGTTETLIEKGIEASLIPRSSTDRDPQEVAAILQDHLDALEGMFAFVKGERELTVGYIKELHSALLRHVEVHVVQDPSGKLFEVPLEKGAYKKLPNNPSRADGSIHEYSPPEHVAAEMDRLVEIHQEHVQAKMPPEVQAAWLHHAFTQIHPFADGNGRVARALATLVFVKGGGFPLIIRREDHARYIEALERGDSGDLAQFVRLLVGAERRVLIRALQALPGPTENAGESRPRKPEDVISGIRDLLNRGGERVIPRNWEAVAPMRAAILTKADNRMEQITSLLTLQVTVLNPQLIFAFKNNSDRRTDEWVLRVRAAAESLGYELATLGNPDVREIQVQPGPTDIIFALHGAGRSYRGVVAGLLVFTAADGSTVCAADDIFQVNYKDALSAVTKRFNSWFEASLTRALEMWRAQI